MLFTLLQIPLSSDGFNDFIIVLIRPFLWLLVSCAWKCDSIFQQLSIHRSTCFKLICIFVFGASQTSLNWLWKRKSYVINRNGLLMLSFKNINCSEKRVKIRKLWWINGNSVLRIKHTAALILVKNVVKLSGGLLTIIYLMLVSPDLLIIKFRFFAAPVINMEFRESLSIESFKLLMLKLWL